MKKIITIAVIAASLALVQAARAASPGESIMKMCTGEDEGGCKVLVAGFMAGMHAAHESDDKGAACIGKITSYERLTDWLAAHTEAWNEPLPTLLYHAECSQEP